MMRGQKSNAAVFVRRKRKAEMNSGFCGKTGLGIILIKILVRKLLGAGIKLKSVVFCLY